MYRITASPMEGSEAPRVFLSQSPPEWSDGMLKFIAHPVPRVVRLLAADVDCVEEGDGNSSWAPWDPSAPRQLTKPKRRRRKSAPKNENPEDAE